MIYFTSDTHFWHKQIINYCNRPVPELVSASGHPEINPLDIWTENTKRMNEWLIQRWNEIIKPDDTVWHLGDFAFCGKDKAIEILERLNGHKNWIVGNHDYSLVKKIGVFFDWIGDYKMLRTNISYEDDEGNSQQYAQPIVLCHFPILSWDGMAHGSWHLHGHCHGSMDRTWNSTGLRMDVGVDAEGADWKPFSLEQIQTRMALRTVMPVDHHSR